MNTGFTSRFPLGLVLVALIALPNLIAAQDKPMDKAEQIKFFESKIRPVLVAECYGCHSQKSGKIRGGLLVDTKKGLEDGGNSGAAVVPGELDESTLWSAINHEDWVMPPNRKLPKNVIEDFRTWIEMGAPDPRVTKKLKVNTTITEADIRKGTQFLVIQKTEKPGCARDREIGLGQN